MVSFRLGSGGIVSGLDSNRVTLFISLISDQYLDACLTQRLNHYFGDTVIGDQGVHG